MAGFAQVRAAAIGLGLMAATLMASADGATAASATEIDAKSDLALNSLLADSETAQAVAEKAVAVLVFPQIVKAGFGVGGQYGEGALRRDGATIGYYSIASASFGLQVGAQSYAQVMYFMTEDALATLQRSKGFEIGADANVAVVNVGKGVDVNSTTIKDPIIAFVVDQQGLMAGVTVEGSKITRIKR
jgi:lipid-binding SYLF domain-containing protein